MSTRAIIARTNQDSFVGVYHHNDGHPTGVGEALYKLYHGHFQDDLSKMLTTLIDKHPGGWSSIVGKDFSKRPGWHGPYGYDYKHGDTHPVCKCHGSRHEKDGKRTSNE